MSKTASEYGEMDSNLVVGVVGSNCVVIAAEKFNKRQNSVCSLDGQITVAWSGQSHDSLKIVEKAKLYTNSIHGLNSPANRVAEFLIDPDIRVLNNLPTLPYTDHFMVASCDQNERCLYVTDTYGTISHVLACAIGRENELISNVLAQNYLSANRGILGAIDLALRSLCVIVEPDTNFIEVTVTAFNRPFEIVDDNIVHTFLSRIKLSRTVNNC